MTSFARAPITPRDLWGIRRVGNPVPAPGGGFVIVGVTTYDLEADQGHEELYLVPSRGDEPRPLTAGAASSSQPAVSPDGRTLAFVRKPPGAARPQLHVLPLDAAAGPGSEAARCLTDLPLGVSDPRWFPDGKQIAVLAPLHRTAPTVGGTRARAAELAAKRVQAHVTEDRVYRYWDRWLSDGEVHHVFAVDAVTGVARDLTPASVQLFDLMDPTGQYDISPDGQEIAFSANVGAPPYTRLRWGIFTARVAGGDLRLVTPDNPADDVRPRYSPDGRWLVHGSRRDPDNYADRVRIAAIDRQSGAHALCTEAWDRSALSWEFVDGRTLVIEAEDQARVPLFALTLGAGESPRLLVRDGQIHAPRPASDGFIYVQHHSFRHPPEVARCPVAGGALERLAAFNDPLLARLALGDTEDVTFEGTHGAVQMYVIYPPGFDRARRWPLVHVIHGGPFAVYSDQWHFRWNPHVLAAAGYVVAQVNYHGSSSFGQAYATSILGRWGAEAASDVLRATDVLVARGFIDPARMALTGGSYGGYLACWLAAQTDRFACGVVHAAVYDLATMVASDVVQGSDRKIGGAPWRLPEGREDVDRYNPAALAGRIAMPTLVSHGERDFRVPLENALALYGTLKANGVPARLVYYPDEGHWISKPRNSLHWYGEVLAWLARHL